MLPDLDINENNRMRMRLTSLELAIQVGLHADCVEDDMIAIAEKFHNFLKGEEND